MSGAGAAGLGPPAREVFAGYPVERLVGLITDLDAKPRGFPDAARLLRRLAELLADPEPLIADAGADADGKADGAGFEAFETTAD